mmetsp:Transcript_5065/g.16451  ORF Transcript_5065/g.16451 Transcript_5065/m.16451 type:complete len:257 (+) Transcript_5065:291-1061(+)
MARRRRRTSSSGRAWRSGTMASTECSGISTTIEWWFTRLPAQGCVSSTAGPPGRHQPPPRNTTTTGMQPLRTAKKYRVVYGRSPVGIGQKVADLIFWIASRCDSRGTRWWLSMVITKMRGSLCAYHCRPSTSLKRSTLMPGLHCRKRNSGRGTFGSWPTHEEGWNSSSISTGGTTMWPFWPWMLRFLAPSVTKRAPEALKSWVSQSQGTPGFGGPSHSGQWQSEVRKKRCLPLVCSLKCGRCARRSAKENQPFRGR